MLVTMFVDASFFEETGAAAFALYAVSERDKFTFAMRLKPPIHNFRHAEYMGIAKGLSIILPHRTAAGASMIRVLSDCKVALRYLRDGSRGRYPKVDAELSGLQAKYPAVSIVGAYVPGHSPDETVEAKLHNWCDTEARRLARRSHEERKRPRK